MKLADFGSCGGRLEMRAEASPCEGMPFSRDCPVRCDRERCAARCPGLSTLLLALGLVDASGVPVQHRAASAQCLVILGLVVLQIADRSYCSLVLPFLVCIKHRTADLLSGTVSSCVLVEFGYQPCARHLCLMLKQMPFV